AKANALPGPRQQLTLQPLSQPPVRRPPQLQLPQQLEQQPKAQPLPRPQTQSSLIVSQSLPKPHTQRCDRPVSACATTADSVSVSAPVSDSSAAAERTYRPSIWLQLPRQLHQLAKLRAVMQLEGIPPIDDPPDSTDLPETPILS